MAQARWWLCLLCVGACALGVQAGRAPQPEVVLIYKDGFTIKGNVHEKTTALFDSASGRAFPIFTGNFYIDDQVRNILFSRDQVNSVTRIKPTPINSLVRFKWYRQPQAISPKWQFESISPWDEKGERTAFYQRFAGDSLPMTQRIARFSPRQVYVITDNYQWDLLYFTQELGPEFTRDLLFRTYSENKELKKIPDAQKLIQIGMFMQEAGWYEEAEKELTRCVENFPVEGKFAQEKLDKLKEVRATLFVESIEQARNVGQHQEARERLRTYDKENYQKLVSPKHRLQVKDWQAEYASAKADIDEAKAYLKDFPAYTAKPAVWAKACEFILKELNDDTVERLKNVFKFAQQHAAERKSQAQPAQTTEEVLAMAISSWLQGKQAVESDPKLALKLVQARQIVLDYLKSDDAQVRADLLSTFKTEVDLPADMIARLVRMVPPSHPLDAKKLGTQVTTQAIEAPDSNGGSYLLHLPPGYDPMRAYPVLLVLGGSLEETEATLKKFTEEAAKQGFILAAPLWSGKGGHKAKYQYSAKEHALVLDTLRDLRRRLQIDSDRVFLFGWEEGANMAFDVGLGHPDLFAGVVPMNLSLPTFTRRYYWPNAQYLPFYIIDGERNTANSKTMRDLFKDWTREPYMATYVEYKGRGTEWYSAEVPIMLNWMSRKKRQHPVKEMGRHNPRVGLGEEFRSSRPFDNRFYWLSSEALTERHLNPHNVAPTVPYFHPATFQAYLTTGNRVNAKKEAEVWNEIVMRVTGMKQVTVWLTENMKLDFERPLVVREVNTNKVLGARKIQPSVATMLEELSRSGDRQRLIVAKIDIALDR